MSYYITKHTDLSFSEALEKAINELKNEGFGVITTIDVKDTLKQKLDVEFRNYTILGACNPHYAHQALNIDDKIGTLLPCNVIIQETDEGTEVSAIDPHESMKAIIADEVVELSKQITAKLTNVINNIPLH